MSIADPVEAERFLSNVNYYRFRRYLEPFVDQTTSSSLRPFQPGTTYGAVIDRYAFDAKLRTLLLEALGYIEVSIRAQWTYHLSFTQAGGERAHLNPLFFSTQHGDNLAVLQQDYEDHGKNTHRYEFNDCPTWAVSEVMSLGQLSRWYRSTIPQVRRLVADHYDLHERLLRSVLRHLVTIRNCCAHHELMWDREFITKLPVPTRVGGFANPGTFFNHTDTGKLYNTLVMVAYLTSAINENKAWSMGLVDLMSQNLHIPQASMGFIPGWEQLAIWQR